jgi:putative ABC transport system ATP-binding protein
MPERDSLAGEGGIMLLTIEQLEKTYAGPEGPVPVLQKLDLELAASDTLALTGESGSGKSTLLHLVGGLDTADGGKIIIANQEITRMTDAERAALRRGTVGVVFQQFNLISSLSVEANISFHARLSHQPDQAYIAQLVDALGLGDHLRKYPEQLSGGQQQRVAIARTLAAKPKLVLADEPTGNLDEDTAARVLDEMLELVAETGAALMLVTHSPAVAQRMARQVHLSHGRLM